MVFILRVILNTFKVLKINFDARSMYMIPKQQRYGREIRHVIE